MPPTSIAQATAFPADDHRRRTSAWQLALALDFRTAVVCRGKCCESDPPFRV